MIQFSRNLLKNYNSNKNNKISIKKKPFQKQIAPQLYRIGDHSYIEKSQVHNRYHPETFPQYSTVVSRLQVEPKYSIRLTTN